MTARRTPKTLVFPRALYERARAEAEESGESLGAYLRRVCDEEKASGEIPAHDPPSVCVKVRLDHDVRPSDAVHALAHRVVAGDRKPKRKRKGRR